MPKPSWSHTASLHLGGGCKPRRATTRIGRAGEILGHAFRVGRGCPGRLVLELDSRTGARRGTATMVPTQWLTLSLLAGARLTPNQTSLI